MLTRTSSKADPADRTTTSLKVCHLIHTTGIGGVETAVAAIREHQPAGVHYSIGAFGGSENGAPAVHDPDFVGSGVNSPATMLRIVKWLLNERCGIVVVSLWRSVLAGALVKMLRPSTTLIVFFHNTRYTNPLDRLSHRIGLRVADAFFVDCDLTRTAMLDKRAERKQVHVVPLVLRKPTSEERHVHANDDSLIELVFWGRLAQQKRLDLAVELLAELNNRLTMPVRLNLFGPDHGQIKVLMPLARRLGVDELMTWHGPAEWETIVEAASHATFFVQLSDFEGLGMAAIESMQLGLVPVVTPVGQIAEYTTDGVDAVHYVDAASTADRIIGIWTDGSLYSGMSASALARWKDQPSAATSFFAACHDVNTSRAQ